MDDARQYTGKRYSALWQLTLVRWREFSREPEAIFWTFLFPILLAAGLGLAFRDRPPETLYIGVVAHASLHFGGDSAGPGSVNVNALDGNSQIAVTTFASDSAAWEALTIGSVALLVTTAADGSISYIFDPSRPEARSARSVVDEILQRAAGRTDPLTVSDVIVEEKGSRYIDFLIPGLLAMSIMGTGIWSVVFSVVTARTKKLLKRLIATPMSRMQYLASFVVARFIFLLAEVTLLLAFGRWVFDVPIRGSLLAIFTVALLSAFSFNALGLLLASRAKTIEGVSGLTNFVMFPMWICSGVFFASTNFPNAVQPFIKALPLTATVDALREIMLQGVPLTSVLPEIGILLAWLVVSFVIALRIFRWR